MWPNPCFNLWWLMDLCCRQPGHEIFYLWVFSRGLVWPALPGDACVHANRKPAYPNKHTQTNVIYLERLIESRRGRVFALVFTVSGCYFNLNCYLTKMFGRVIIQLVSYSELRTSLCLHRQKPNLSSFLRHSSPVGQQSAPRHPLSAPVRP